MESNRRKFLSTGIGAGVAGVALGAPNLHKRLTGK
jgi:hypothetical protein